MTDAELRALLTDCLVLWNVTGTFAAAPDGMELATMAGRFRLRRAASDDRPIRWLLHTPERDAAGRGPRALPSIVAALSALRRETLGG